MDQGFEGIMSALSLFNILLTCIGVLVGIIFGAIPGLTTSMAVALSLPVTFGMDPISSMCLLVGLFMGGVSGGLISAILLKIPGTPGSLATTFDGHPMAVNGMAGKALTTGIIFSFLGSIFSVGILMLIAPQLAELAIRFTPFDYFSIILFSLTMMIGLSGKSIVKGFLSGLLGMTFAMIGSSPVDGNPRFTLGFSELNAGLTFLPVMIGIFAVSQILGTAENALSASRQPHVIMKIGKIGLSFKEFKSQISNFFYASAIGTFIGILPGIGGGTANLLAYTAVRNKSRYPEKFGTGIIDGVVASESANNAAIGGAMVPLLSLGIPGDPVTALLIGAFMIHGITPGPLLYATQSNLVYAIFTALIVASFAMLILMFSCLRIFSKVLDVPKSILLPLIFGICAVGTFGADNRIFGIGVMVFFGIIGFLLKKNSFPIPPMVMGFVLGPILEANLRRGLMYSKGSMLPFLTQPVSGIMLFISAISLGYGLYKYFRQQLSSVGNLKSTENQVQDEPN